jgi:hypothetical protein
MADQLLIQEARQLATGADIHNVDKFIAFYTNPYNGPSGPKIRAIAEEWLRKFVTRKKLEKSQY